MTVMERPGTPVTPGGTRQLHTEGTIDVPQEEDPPILEIKDGVVTGRLDHSGTFDTASLIADLSEEAILVDAVAIQANAYNLADTYRAQANSQMLQTFGQTFGALAGGFSGAALAPAGSSWQTQASYFFQGMW